MWTRKFGSEHKTMAMLILLNSTLVKTDMYVAGRIYDDVASAWEIPSIIDAGGKLVAATPTLLRIAELSRSKRARGTDDEHLDAMMLAHALDASTLGYDDTITPPTIAATTVQTAIDNLKSVVLGANLVAPFAAPGMLVGACGYAISNNTLAATDAASYASSIFVAAVAAMSGFALVGGIANALFSLATATPAVGDRVFLARADEDPSLGAAGKLTLHAPVTGYRSEIGVVVSINTVPFPVSRVASVVLHPKAIMHA